MNSADHNICDACECVAHCRKNGCIPISALPVAASKPAAEPVAFSGYLCRAWGETEIPCAEVARDFEGVRRFMVREWLGDEGCTDASGDAILPGLMAELEGRDWKDEGEWSAEFEIGGVSVEPVYGYTTPPAVMPAEPLHVGDSSFEGWFASKNMKNLGTKQLARDAYAAGMSDPAVMPAAPSDAVSVGFSPMWLAPIDGTPVLLHMPTTGDKFAIGQWHGSGVSLEGHWGDDEGNFYVHEPVGWMSLAVLSTIASGAARSQTMQPQADWNDGRIVGLREAAAIILKQEGKTQTRDRILNFVSLIDAVPRPQAEPAAGEQAGAVAEAMQDAWNDWCSDTGCFPDDFTLKGKTITFKAGRWAASVAAHLAAPGAAIAAREQEAPECERCGLSPAEHAAGHWCDNQSYAVAAPHPKRDALMKLSQFAHTGAHMDERHMRNNLLSIADQLIALASREEAPATPQAGTASIPALHLGWNDCLAALKGVQPVERGEG